jgi:hypothetical protein
LQSYKRLALWISLCLAIRLVPSSLVYAETVDGFVTASNSSSQLEMGTYHVVLTSKTRCYAETLLSTISLRYKTIFTGIPAHNSFVLHDHLVDKSKTAVQCNNAHWQIGARIHAVVTSQTQKSVYLATDITVYTVEMQQDFGAVGGNHEWTGGALLEESPQVSKTADGWAGTLWLDGFPAQVTPDTKLLTAPPGTRLGYGSSTLWGGIWTKTILAKGSTPPFSGALFKPNTWVFYRGVGGVAGRLRLSYLRMWPNLPDSEFTKYQSQIASRVQLQYGPGRNEAVFILPSSRHRQQLV